jgi:hypothetical protein
MIVSEKFDWSVRDQLGYPLPHFFQKFVWDAKKDYKKT